MAAVCTGHGTLLLHPYRSSSLFRKGHDKPVPIKITSSAPRDGVRVAPMSSLIAYEPNTMENSKALTGLSTLTCPICHDPFKSINGSSITSLECEACKKTYFSNDAYLDLTIDSVSQVKTWARRRELFRIPLVSFLYERGWRQRFAWGGFPGPEKEFEMAKDYLTPTFGGTIIDASCGSGLFSRMFSKSGLYRSVFALDFSENMLKQCSYYMERDGISRQNVVVVRADIANLPFKSGSIDAVHAGAAIHCWPSPSDGMAEISRVLRPGGKFVATTFMTDGKYNEFPRSLVRQVLVGIAGLYLSTAEEELEDLFKSNGFVNLTCMRNRLFVMMSATKSS